MKQWSLQNWGVLWIHHLLQVNHSTFLRDNQGGLCMMAPRAPEQVADIILPFENTQWWSREAMCSLSCWDCISLWGYPNSFDCMRKVGSCLWLKWEKCWCSQPAWCLISCASCFCSERLPFFPAKCSKTTDSVRWRSTFQPSLLTEFYFPSVSKETIEKYVGDNLQTGERAIPGSQNQLYASWFWV